MAMSTPRGFHRTASEVSPTRLKDAASKDRLLLTGLEMSSRTSVTAVLHETAIRPTAKPNLPRTMNSPNIPTAKEVKYKALAILALQRGDHFQAVPSLLRRSYSVLLMRVLDSRSHSASCAIPAARWPAPSIAQLSRPSQ